MKLLNDWRLIGLLSVTLGLAPFYPEPHVWGKLKWVLGGAKDMQIKDWFDLLLHGFPYILLLRLLIVKAFKKKLLD